MHTPVLTAFIIIFIIWLQFEIRKSSGKQKNNSELFWNKEYESNLSRRKDISKLDYLSVNTKLLPLDDKEDDTINSYRDTILELSDKKLLNLSGFTNTELKSNYGIANMSQLMEYDNNFTAFISIMQKWAERLYAKGYLEDAIVVLEYAIHCKTDVSKSYKLLAEIYKKQKTPEKINNLFHTVNMLSIRDKDKILQALKDIIDS